ncbi:pyruvate dehydrogenase (acetyl-transferring) E1 component subunit alpha [Nanoarchaeota archaeon]
MTEEIVKEFSVKYISVMDEDSNVDERLMPDLNDDDLKSMYWYMNLSRQLDNKMLNLQKQGHMGTFASIHGQEGGEVALAYAVRDVPNVWFVPTFRETAALITHGVPMDQILRYWGGFEEGSRISKDLEVLPVSIPIGSQLDHAQGISHAMKIKGEKGASIVFFGDGATSEGETHEALNFAGVFKTPVIFFCQNNQYAISVPRAKQTASLTLAQKAYAYGYEGIQVDGNDVFAVYRVIKYALDKALNGGGPTFIEAVTYRVEHHTTADDWHKYRTEEEVASWEKKDPIIRLKNYIMKKGIWDDDQEEKMLADAKKQVQDAVDAYEATPAPKIEEIFDYLYEKLPPHIQEQKEQLMRFWNG